MLRVTDSHLSDALECLCESEVAVGCLDVDWCALQRGGLDQGLRVLSEPEEPKLATSVCLAVD